MFSITGTNVCSSEKVFYRIIVTARKEAYEFFIMIILSQNKNNGRLLSKAKVKAQTFKPWIGNYLLKL